jgi:hypothetical protein
MNLQITRFSFLLFVVLIGYSCSNKNIVDKEEGKILAKVNDSKLLFEDIKNNIPTELKGSDSANFVKNLINSWVSNEQFYQQSLRYLNTEEINVEKEIEDYRKDILVHKFQSKLIAEKLALQMISPSTMNIGKFFKFIL